MGQKALVTGITGMDGSHLAELLLEKGYEVHGLVRRQSVESGRFERIEHIKDDIIIHTGDLLDEAGIFSLVQEVQPDELYSLAAQSHVGCSSKIPIFTTKVDATAVVTLLEALRQIRPDCKFYQASSSEMFGNNVFSDGFQRENTPMEPVSPYACAKLFSYHITRHYRSAYNMFACNGILFNHSGPRRGENFVEKKIVNGVWDIVNGDAEELLLGNLHPQRDIGHAKDYVRAMWMMLQYHDPDDYVIATGETHSVEEICNYVFGYFHLDFKEYVKYDPRFGRAQELLYLKGDCSKAKKILGWEPEYTFQTLIEDMIENNIRYNESNLFAHRI